MPWVTEEEIQAAKNMTAYEYLRTHQAQRLQKTRTRNEWQLTDHDSFKINELSSKWHWKSRDIGGVSALRFLIEVDEEVMCALPKCKMAEDIKDVQRFIRNRKGVEYYL